MTRVRWGGVVGEGGGKDARTSCWLELEKRVVTDEDTYEGC